VGAQVADAQDEIEEDLEERDEIVETSEIIDSGDEADEVDRAREERRVKVGNPSVLAGLLHGRGSRARRAMPRLWACDITVPIEGRLEQIPPALTAGVEAVLD
jgi:hypothetical protein